MMKKLLFLLIIGVLLIGIAQGALNITPVTVGTNYIVWGWSSSSVTNVSIDGIKVCNFDINSNSFTLSGLNSDEYHTIIITSDSDIGTNTTKTLPPVQTSSEKTADFTNLYIIFIAGLICCIVGMFVDYIGFGGFVFGCMGIITSIGISFWMGTLYMILIVASIYVAFNKMNDK